MALDLGLGDSELEELFRKYGAGVKGEDGKISIHPIEALYMLGRGRLEIAGESFDSLFAKIRAEDKLADEKYAVFSELRKNGYIARLPFSGEPWIRIYRKGFRPGEDRTQFLAKIVRDGQLSLAGMVEDIRKAAEVRKELVYAVVREGRVTFIKLGRTSFD